MESLEGRKTRIDSGSPSPSPSPKPRDRVPELDALRGLAALAIVVFHVRPSWLGNGWVAVDFFFVLSGYLITNIVLRHGGGAGFLKAFYLRRGLRVWPIYYLAIASVLILNPRVGGGDEIHWDGLPNYLTFTQNVAHHWSPEARFLSRNFLHTWTLAIEEQFYLFWPPVLCLLGRSRGRVAGAAVLLAIASVAIRCQGVPITALLARSDGLALGGLLASILDSRDGRAFAPRRLLRGFALTVVGSIVALVLIRKAAGPSPAMGVPAWPGLTLLAYNLCFFGLIGVVVGATRAPWLAPLRVRPLVGLGHLSYGLYLYHFLLMGWANSLTGRLSTMPPIFARALAAGPVALLVAWLSWRLLERPILQFKDRFPYGKSSFAPSPTRSSVEAGHFPPSARGISTGPDLDRPK